MEGGGRGEGREEGGDREGERREPDMCALELGEQRGCVLVMPEKSKGEEAG